MNLADSPHRTLRLSHQCNLLRIPPGNDPAAREMVTGGWPCSDVYPASAEQAERAGLATVYRLMVVYLAATDVRPDWRLATDGREYRIRAASHWPRAGSRFVELLVEDEG